MSNYQNIILDEQNGTAHLWLNRPERHNALNPDMMYEIVSALEELEEAGTRLLIIRGKGASFCAGADIAWMRKAAQQEECQNQEESRLLAEVFYRIHNFPAPTISLVHGNVIGGGMGLMAATDYTLSAVDCHFKLSEVRLGLLPATIFPYLLNRSSEFRIRELSLTATSLYAQQALEYNLINRIAIEGKIEEELKQLVVELRKGAPGAQREVKDLIRKLSGRAIDENLVAETVTAIRQRRLSKEGQEGMTSFLEKRKPNWVD